MAVAAPITQTVPRLKQVRLQKKLKVRVGTTGASEIGQTVGQLFPKGTTANN